MIIKFCVLYIAFFAVTNAVSVKDVIAEEWNLFKMQYGKNYATIFEEEYRFQIFTENKYRVAQHNKLFAAGEVAFEVEINHLSDMVPNEIVNINSELTGDLEEEAMNEADEINFSNEINYWIPRNFDWRSNHSVTGVKDQGHCKSSWAFAAIGALESQEIIKKRHYVSLSAQNLIDCSKNNSACNGGSPFKALQYIQQNNGIDTEQSYPYKAKYNKTCSFKQKFIGSRVRTVRTIEKGNERSLLSMIYNYGPIAVSMNVEDYGFHSYKSGIYSNRHCSKVPNHSLLIVGYGTKNRRNYWIAKNSWGIHWGDKGYIKIARDENTCGIANNAVYPTIG